MSKAFQHITGGNRVQVSMYLGSKPDLTATILCYLLVEDTKIYVVVEIGAKWTKNFSLLLSSGTWRTQEEGKLHKGGDI